MSLLMKSSRKSWLPIYMYSIGNVSADAIKTYLFILSLVDFWWLISIVFDIFTGVHCTANPGDRGCFYDRLSNFHRILMDRWDDEAWHIMLYFNTGGSISITVLHYYVSSIIWVHVIQWNCIATSDKAPPAVIGNIIYTPH